MLRCTLTRALMFDVEALSPGRRAGRMLKCDHATSAAQCQQFPAAEMCHEVASNLRPLTALICYRGRVDLNGNLRNGPGTRNDDAIKCRQIGFDEHGPDRLVHI